MQGICNYISETNHVFRVYCVAAVKFGPHVMLFHMLNVFCTFTSVYYIISIIIILNSLLLAGGILLSPDLNSILLYLKNQMLYQGYATKIVTTSLHFQLPIIFLYIYIYIYIYLCL